ncbi:MAG TPA: adenylate/guanylate cyclase domain-containing protein [Candidatus Limnocylindrales bacterium]|nr:adenylate/guanylate cyclase domain-containing protein [Candidatus Limnocylindrales bacterium]
MSEVSSQTPNAAADPLAAGRAAAARHDWQAAFELLSEADRAGSLSADDLEGLALAAFFSARADVEIEFKERAYGAHVAEGNTLRAAYLAIDMAREYGFAGKNAIAGVWIRRAERLIGTEGETYAHGYLAVVRSEAAAMNGDIDAALAQAQHAIEIGDQTADADLNAFALTNLGSLKIATGEPVEGFALMEEASLAAVNGELSPFTTGVTACRMISACRDLTDYRRASEWIEATERYCQRQALSGFPGVCRIHRAEVAAVGGAWDRAEEELERATTELSAYNATPPQADGFYAIGDIRRLKGDFEGAEAALREAHARGRSPQPALALIRLAEGNTKAAVSGINAALGDKTWDRWGRARLLPAKVEIAIAAGDVTDARTAIDELAGIVAGYPSPALDAGRGVATGRVLLAEGDPEAAATELRGAVKLWREVGAPYEIARARVVLSRALRAVDDEEDAELELHAALDEFRRLGARVDIEATERELQEAEQRRSGPVTTRRTFMFTDIVGSTNLAEAMGDAAWARLLHWHDDTLRAIVMGGGGEIVKSTGDGIFAAFDSARRGLDCAIAIQRALRDHGTTIGFAPPVRIGLHTADASQRGGDYTGMGVHVAARVAALAGGGEIFATKETLAEAGDTTATDAREAVVKGVGAPVGIATIVWR